MWPQTVGQAESAMSDELQLEEQLTPQQPNSSAQSSGSAREALASGARHRKLRRAAHRVTA